MKKLICIIVSLVLVLSLAACTPQEPNDTTGNTDSTPETSTSNSAEDTAEPGVSDTQEPDNAPDTTVEITFPASLFEDAEDFDPAAYAREQGFLSAVVNEDGSVTVTMTETKHNELISEMTKTLEETFAGFVEGDTTPYIKEITHNDDFTKVTIKVVRAEYENAFDFTVVAIGMSVPIAQIAVGFEANVEISVVDVDTGDVISSVVYPDALKG